MVESMNFNFHNLLQMGVRGEHGNKFMNYMEREYSYFKRDSSPKSELIIIIGDFEPKNEDCTIINHKYFVKKNYFYCEDSYKVVKWKVEIENFEGNPTTVRYHGNYFADSFLVRYVVEPLLWIKLLEKGVATLHSSGVCDGKRAFLLTACKGVGKTSTILNLVNEGGTYMSDDFTLLSKDGIVYSYPTTIHLFAYNLKTFPQEVIPNMDRTKTKMYDLIYKLSLGYGSLPVDVNVERVWGKIGDQSPLSAVILLTKTNKKKEDLEVKKITGSEVASRTIPINILEAFNFYDYMLAYSYVFPDSNIATHWKRLEEMLKKILKNIPCYLVEIPKEYTLDSFETIKHILKENEYKLKGIVKDGVEIL